MTPDSVCFVVMPFGQKPDQMGGVIDFDLVYRTLLSPAISDAGMSPLRVDEVHSGGFLFRDSLQQVMSAPFAVFDVTTSNPNVLYELGVRHAMRSNATLLIAAQGSRIPFDLLALRVVFYQLNSAGRPENVEGFRQTFAEHLRARERVENVDSPIYLSFADLRPPELAPLATSSPRTYLPHADELKKRIMAARRLGIEELENVERELGDISEVAAEVVLTMFDAYRATGAYQKVIDLVGRMHRSVAATTRVQEQLALALNRVGRWVEAEEVLKRLLPTTGASSETYGVLGRVYKDQWDASLRRSDAERAAAFLDRAIEAYLAGFELDWRDPYPGVNAVTLMTIRQPVHPRRDEMLPVVAYAAKRKMEQSRGDYWNAATLLELAVIGGQVDDARRLLTTALATAQDPWQTETTANNLRLIREALAQRGEGAAWIEDIEQTLTRAGRQRPMRRDGSET